MIEKVLPRGVEMSRFPYVPTVRVIIQNHEGKVLLLRKSMESKAKGRWEFPGGGIDAGDFRGPGLSGADAIFNAGIREIYQETRVDLRQTILDLRHFFTYSLSRKETSRPTGVYVITAKLDKTPDVKINLTRNAAGQPVDNHIDFEWVTRRQLGDKRRDGQLLRSSCDFDSILGFEY